MSRTSPPSQASQHGLRHAPGTGVPGACRTDVVVIGAGFSGIAAAARLVEDGHDVLVLEQGDDVGGTWRENTYPGAGCDVPAHLYALSFAPNPYWTRAYAGQAEILDYLRKTVRDLDLWPRIRLRTRVTSACWEAESASWLISTDAGAFSAPILVATLGSLSQPAMPAVRGLDRFGGPIVHSARWPADLNLRGRRVAVVGTGASAVQVVPALVDDVEQLVLLQRTPTWVMPRANTAFPRWRKEALARSPRLHRAYRRVLERAKDTQLLAFRSQRVGEAAARMARAHLHAQVHDSELRRVLTPDYAIGCKRITPSDSYYPALTRPHVEVIPHALAALDEKGVIAADGTTRHVDVVVMCTGFQTSTPPITRIITGRAGLTLAQTWRRGARAFLGTTVSGFPNLFLMGGPNTGLGHTSVVLMIEAQVEHIRRVLDWMQQSGVAATEPTAAAQRRWVDDVDAVMSRTVWSRGGCRSWYQDESGRVAALWPSSARAFRRQAERFNASSYRVVTAATPLHDAPPGRSVEPAPQPIRRQANRG